LNVLLEHHLDKLKELEKGPEPFFNPYKYCQQGKDPEKVKLWTMDICKEAEHAIDQQYYEMIKESKSKGSKKHRWRRAKQLSKNLHLLDYDLPPLEANGPSHRGITALQGDNHGDFAFWIHCQFHLPSPEE
jgi:hypothetical protein